MRANDACLLYVVSREPDDPDAIWVTRRGPTTRPTTAGV
jgi:hypothetical protein